MNKNLEPVSDKLAYVEPIWQLNFFGNMIETAYYILRLEGAKLIY